MELTLRTRTVGPRTVVDVSGEIDMYTAPQLRERLLELVNAGSIHIAVDMNAVEFCDSTGLGVLIGALKRLRERRGSLIIVCDNPRLMKIFQLTGLHNVLDIRSALPAGE